MPNVNVLKKELFEAIGHEIPLEEFENLCFQIGFELEHGTGEEM